MIHYLIIEDEQLLSTRLERMVSELKPSWKLSGRTSSVEESVEFLQKEEVDLIFMDIELSDGNCFEILDRIHVRKPIIFTTAYDEYALEAFQVNGTSYLLKPIRKEALLSAIEKLEQIRLFPDENPHQERLRIQTGNGFTYLNTCDIAWFCKNDRYTEVHTFAGQRFLLDQSLDKIENSLAGNLFFRTSRNGIVNIKSISSIERHSNGRLKIITIPPSETDILVTQARREEFLLWLGDEL